MNRRASGWKGSAKKRETMIALSLGPPRSRSIFFWSPSSASRAFSFTFSFFSLKAASIFF